MFRTTIQKLSASLSAAFLVVHCDTYRDQILGHYENRVRAFSHPFKVFQYFATINNEYMTMEDFVRSLIPYNSKDHITRLSEIRIPKDSSLLLADLNKDGKIGFDEYLFYLSLLTIPLRSLKSAFNLFDKNNSGGVDEEELQEMLSTFSRQSAGFVQRIGTKQQIQPFSIIKSLFGDTDVVKYKDFEHFIKLIKDDLLKIEFDLYNKNGVINVKDFAYIITNYAHPTVQIELGDRIDNLPTTNYKMNLQDFLSFHDALSNIDEFDYALKLFLKDEKYNLNKTDLSHIFKVTTNRELKPEETDMLYNVFSTSEFDAQLLLSTLTRRRFRGLNEHRDTGFTRFASNFFECMGQ